MNLDTGSVLRCDPDGTELEVFATGLRNPQELAFDEYGNLFTGDNNSDSGDKARWVYVVEGGDSGWRIGYQFIEAPVSRGPVERREALAPAHGTARPPTSLPPIANIADGPSGLTYDPGTGLPERYDKHFFLCDFRGGPSGQSGIRPSPSSRRGPRSSWSTQRSSSGDILATDVDFGPDGALYVSDWVDGWDMPGKGRIYKVYDPAIGRGPASSRETKKLIAEGMARRPLDELAKLLGTQRHARAAGGAVRPGRPRAAASIADAGRWCRRPATRSPGCTPSGASARSAARRRRRSSRWCRCWPTATPRSAPRRPRCWATRRRPTRPRRLW